MIGNRTILKVALCLVFSLVFLSWVNAQSVKLDQDKWNELSDSLNYGTETEDIPEPVEEDDEPIVYEENRPDLLPKFSMAPIRVVALIVVLVILILGVMYILDKDMFRKMGRKTRLRVNIEDPDYLDQSDLERALDISLNGKDYRSSIRIYYLLLLEKLDRLKLIHWKKAKTNRTYILEVRGGTSLRKNLRTLTRVYEDVWFGEHDLSTDSFNKWSQEFKNLIAKPN